MDKISKDEFAEHLKAIAALFDDPLSAMEILKKHTLDGILCDSAKVKINVQKFLERQVSARNKRDKNKLPSPVKILKNELDGNPCLESLFGGRHEPAAGMDIQYGGYE